MDEEGQERETKNVTEVYKGCDKRRATPLDWRPWTAAGERIERMMRKNGEKNCVVVGGGGDCRSEVGTGSETNEGGGIRLAGWRRCDGSMYLEWIEPGEAGRRDDTRRLAGKEEGADK